MSGKAAESVVNAGAQPNGADLVVANAPAPPEPCEIIDGIEINAQFRESLRWLNETNACIFITGKAGTGKSTLLQHFVRHTTKTVVLLAP